LIPVLKDEEQNARDAAAEALRKLGWHLDLGET
jgi:HEAT repeat protein